MEDNNLPNNQDANSAGASIPKTPEAQPEASMRPGISSDSSAPAPNSVITPAQPQSSAEGSAPDVTSPSESSQQPPVQSFATKPSSKSGGGKKNTLLIGIIAAVVLLVGGSAAAYFGFIVPNKPENVWAKALSNTADGFDSLSDHAKEQSEAKGFSLKGSLAISTPDGAGDVNIDVKTYEKQGEGKIDIGFAGSRYELEVRGITKENAKTPDLYLKASGLKSAGALMGPDYAPLLNQLDEQWIFVDHTMLDQGLAMIEQSSSDAPEFTPEDLEKISDRISEANREYLLASDDKAVFTVVEEVGKEDFEGRESYHFKVGVNKENLKAYIEALKTGLADTKIKELAGDDYDSSFDDVIKGIEESSDTDNETVDVWVDMSTKTIRNIRIATDEEGEHVDISMLYEGGDVFPFQLKTTTDEGDFNFGLELDLKNDSVKLSVDVKNTEEGMSVTGEFTSQPQNDPLNVEVPSDSKSVNDILAMLMGSSSSSLGGSSSFGPSPRSSQGSSSMLDSTLMNGFQL